MSALTLFDLAPLCQQEPALYRDMLRVARGMSAPATRAAWDGSPFLAFKGVSPTVYGSMFERLLTGWLALQGVDCRPRRDSSCDRMLGARALEIKGATLTTSGTFIFNQIRDQDYDYCALLGLSPHAAYLWVESKENCWRLGREQHGGRSADASRNTRQITVSPSWIGPDTDGSLACALGRMREIERGPGVADPDEECRA